MCVVFDGKSLFKMETSNLLICVFTLVFSVVLWYSSHVARYYIKFTFYNIVVVFLTGAWLIPYCLRRPKDVRNLRAVAGSWTFMFKYMGMNMEILDGENLVSDKPYVLVCNHQSSLDCIPMMRILPDRSTILAKKELIYAGTFGVAAWLCGVVFIDRMSSDKARNTMKETAQNLVKNNWKMWIFPEGTRSLSDVMLPFKKGAFHLAIQAQVPIVPVVVSSYQNLLNYDKRKFESGRVLIQCLKPIPTEGLTKDDVNKLTEDTRDVMMDVFTKNSIVTGAIKADKPANGVKTHNLAKSE